MTLTQKQKEDYVKSPNHCPYCNSTNIEGQAGMFSDKNYDDPSQIVICLECGRGWREYYSVSDIEEV